tara:strand:+ start:4534 stop:5463 length:930 start_codon:yes stop_codon:yes gene_type:complete
MFNLNFDEGSPIAYIKGGEHSGEILYRNSNKEHKNKKKIDMDEIAILIENLYRTMNGKLSFKTLEQLRDAIMEKKRPINRELARHYDHAIKILDDTKNKEVVLQEGELNTMFDENVERQVFMIAGMSGSGKSTYTAGLCRTYKKQYPDNKIILFSNKPSDPVFDRLEYIERVLINEELLDDPITLNELEDCLVVFDDVEYNTVKEIDKELDRIRDLILQQGRSYRCSFVYISHQANNYKQTRTILNECNSVTIFPAMTTRYSLKYLLEKYFGFDKHQITKLCKLPSRWVTIYKAPPLVLYSSGAYLVNT